MNDAGPQPLDFEAAALAHAEWKLKLTHYIFGEGKLDAAVVCRDDQCLFGRWVHGPGKAHEGHPRFAPLRDAHARFHREAARVVELVDNRDVAQARRLIADDSAYVAVSKEVIGGLFALKDDLQRARERALVRLEQAVRGASVPLVITDPQLVITFANDAAQRMMSMHQAVLQEALRGFSATSLVGMSIAAFFKDAGQLQRLLTDVERTPLRAELKFGPLTFRTTVTAVHDERGNAVGATMEWSDVTVQVDAEGQLQRVLGAAAEGSLNERIDVSRMEGFVKTMGESINGLLTVIAEPVAQTSRVVGAMADGDFTVAATGAFKGAFGDMVRDLDMCRDNLRSAVARIRDAAALIAQGASELNDGNNNLSNRTQQQAAALEETTATVTAMASHLRQSAEAARGVSELAAKARSVAADGGDVVSRATVAMSEIKGSSARIADIIGVIDEIAFQTNLLALNAAVEAARAGDQGRGFAVVASEVRSLAQRSATAAKEIKGLIKDSVAKVELGTRLVDQSGATLKDIVDNSKRVSDMVATIASSSDQQATNIDHVEKAVTEMDEMTQQNAALVEEAAAASSAMDSQARQLDEIVGGFRVTDDDEGAAPAPRRRKSERPQHRRDETRSVPQRSPVPHNVRPLRATGPDRRR